jgi:hypothetical protein
MAIFLRSAILKVAAALGSRYWIAADLLTISDPRIKVLPSSTDRLFHGAEIVHRIAVTLCLPEGS